MSRGDAANDLFEIVLDPNVHIQESKAATCDIRPGRMSHVSALTSWMCTFGSRTAWVRSFAAPPVVRPREPQW